MKPHLLCLMVLTLASCAPLPKIGAYSDQTTALAASIKEAKDAVIDLGKEANAPQTELQKINAAWEGVDKAIVAIASYTAGLAALIEAGTESNASVDALVELLDVAVTTAGAAAGVPTPGSKGAIKLLFDEVRKAWAGNKLKTVVEKSQNIIDSISKDLQGAVTKLGTIEDAYLVTIQSNLQTTDGAKIASYVRKLESVEKLSMNRVIRLTRLDELRSTIESIKGAKAAGIGSSVLHAGLHRCTKKTLDAKDGVTACLKELQDNEKALCAEARTAKPKLSEDCSDIEDGDSKFAELKEIGQWIDRVKKLDPKNGVEKSSHPSLLVCSKLARKDGFAGCLIELNVNLQILCSDARLLAPDLASDCSNYVNVRGEVIKELVRVRKEIEHYKTRADAYEEALQAIKTKRAKRTEVHTSLSKAIKAWKTAHDKLKTASERTGTFSTTEFLLASKEVYEAIQNAKKDEE